MLKMGAGTRDSPITIDDDSENEVLQELFNQSSKTIQSNHSHKAGKSAMADQAINYGYSPLSRDKSPIPLVQETHKKRKRANSTISAPNGPINNLSHGPPPPYSSIESTLIRAESKKARKRRRQFELEAQIVQQPPQTLPLAITQPKRDFGKKSMRELTHNQPTHDPSSHLHSQAIIKQQSLPISLPTFPTNCWSSLDHPFNHLLPLRSQQQLYSTATSPQFMNPAFNVDESFHYTLANIGLSFATTPPPSSWVSSMAMAAENSAHNELMRGPRLPYSTTSTASFDPSLILPSTSADSTRPGPSKLKNTTTHIPTAPRAFSKKDVSKPNPPESRLQPPEPPTGPAQKRPLAQKIIGMMPDINPNSKHGTFSKQDGYTPNPARTLVMEQLPKNLRNREYVIKWVKSTSSCRPQPLEVIVEKTSGKALIEFPSAELARAAWASPKLTERKGNIQLWWYRLEGVGAGAGVGEIEEGEIEEDTVEQVSNAPPTNETKKERKSRLATERAQKIAIFKATQQGRAQKEAAARLQQATVSSPPIVEADPPFETVATIKASQNSAIQSHVVPPLTSNYFVPSRPSNPFPSAPKCGPQKSAGHVSPYSASLAYQGSIRYDNDRESIASSRRSTSLTEQDLGPAPALFLGATARDDEDMEVDDDDMILDLPHPNNPRAGTVETGFGLAAVPDPPLNQPTKHLLMDNGGQTFIAHDRDACKPSLAVRQSNNHDMTRHPSTSLNLPSLNGPSPTPQSASEDRAFAIIPQGASNNAPAGTSGISKLARLKDLEERIARGKRELEDRIRMDDEGPRPPSSSALQPVPKPPLTLPSRPAKSQPQPRPQQIIAVGDKDKQLLEEKLRQRVLTSQKSRARIGDTPSAPLVTVRVSSASAPLTQSREPQFNARTPQLLDSLNFPPAKLQVAIINEEPIDSAPSLPFSASVESQKSRSNLPPATSFDHTQVPQTLSNVSLPQVQAETKTLSKVSPVAEGSISLTHPSLKPVSIGYSSQTEPPPTSLPVDSTPNQPIPTSLDDVAVSFIKQTIEDMKANPQDAKPILNHIPRQELRPDPDDLATKRKRLESHIEEITMLMLEHERASTKEEKCKIMAVMREKTRLNEEEKRVELSNLPKVSHCQHHTRAICWPKSRDDAGVIILSDDESDEDMEE